MPLSARRRAVAYLTAVALSAGALSGCSVVYLGAPVTAKDAEVISASENEISIGVFGWFRPDALAGEHCRRYDKEAVFQATMRANEYSDARIVYYNCVWPTTTAG